MATMPVHLENTDAEPIWREIEKIAQSQGVDPSKSEVLLTGITPRFVEAIESLERVHGVTIVRRDEQFDALVVRLVYEGDEGATVVREASTVMVSKPSTQKA